MKTQLYFLPDVNRTITRNGLAAEIEFIAREYPCFIDTVIDDMVDYGFAIPIDQADPKAATAEPEQRTILTAQLFSEMSNNEIAMAYFENDETALLETLRESDDATLEYYKDIYMRDV